jgi:hypothetical protein
MDVPEPMAVPPQDPEYHFQESLAPSESPFTVRVTLAPAVTAVEDAKMDIAAVLEFGRIFAFVSSQSPEAAIMSFNNL